MQDPNEKTREKAAIAFGAGLKDNLRTFALISNTLGEGQGNFRPLARFQGRRGRAASRQPGRARGRRCAGRRRARRLSAPLAPLLQAQGQMVRQARAETLGPQRAAAACRAQDLCLGRGARHRARRL